MYNQFLKRLMDFVLATLLFILLSPLSLTISVILLLLRIKVFFVQKRPGKNGKIFKIFKFTTMLELYDEQNNILPDEKRGFKFGLFLRKYSLDEIPQLINVIIGDMSLVGPRPLLKEYIYDYNTEQLKRHDVRPGITGWAQINGRNSLTLEKKIELDLYYINNASFKLDLTILFLTIWKVILSKDININKYE
jgi:undecaprenyl phosphate N,N'-diacetylbacillosamine 1-phosphate transferase